mmetsp:Transcript_5231/g.17144  ORF Transcript_5231/g.17144 Transcript_5231/m.17144 type:complete len:346 (-) Transcript_5231:9-1046(-)
MFVHGDGADEAVVEHGGYGRGEGEEEVEDDEAVHAGGLFGELEVAPRSADAPAAAVAVAVRVEVPRVLRGPAADDDAGLAGDAIEDDVQNLPADVVVEEVDALRTEGVQLRADVATTVVHGGVDDASSDELTAAALAAGDAHDEGPRAPAELRRDAADGAAGRAHHGRLASSRRTAHLVDADVRREPRRRTAETQGLRRRAQHRREARGVEDGVGPSAEHAEDPSSAALPRDDPADAQRRHHAPDGHGGMERLGVEGRTNEGVDRQQLHLYERQARPHLRDRLPLQGHVPLGVEGTRRPRPQHPLLASHWQHLHCFFLPTPKKESPNERTTPPTTQATNIIYHKK